MCTKATYNDTFKQLAEWLAIESQAADQVKALKQEIINYMKSEDIETLQGIEHKATYKKVTSNRLDTKALKLDMPAVYDKYSRETKSNRFNFS